MRKYDHAIIERQYKDIQDHRKHSDRSCIHSTTAQRFLRDNIRSIILIISTS